MQGVTYDVYKLIVPWICFGEVMRGYMSCHPVALLRSVVVGRYLKNPLVWCLMSFLSCLGCFVAVVVAVVVI